MTLVSIIVSSEIDPLPRYIIVRIKSAMLELNIE